ncbi:uncharacterized protein LOC121389024 [Gigantopelta aegis]|uniref:uncharacterized protein LOC121389024 n=1 Tax=Gigantopelta aegis TaxID=1735272 RepID=UPI001B88B741|nr:uncharacterized protein LOC121389024 [Gigantopelta aegis]
MTKEIPNEKSFGRKLRKSYKSAKSRLECARLCYNDDRCNGMLVCPGVCHLFGVFSVAQSPASGTDYLSCDVFNMNRCENNGVPDDSGYCSCTRGYGGPFCDTVVHDLCYQQWQLIPESVNALYVASKNSCAMKLKFVTSDKKIHTMNSFGVSSDNTWAQSLFHLSKSSWNTFDANPQRMFNITVNAKYQTVVAFDIEGSMAPSSTKEITATWYVKNFSNVTPFFENDASGAAVTGDLDALVAKIRGGSAIVSLTTVFVSENLKQVAGGGIDRLAKTIPSTHASFSSKPFWFLYRFTSSGSKHVLRWHVGEGSYKSNKTNHVPNTWCTDDCWIKVFTVDQLGKGVHGSTTQLARSLLSGHRLRVYTMGVAANTKTIYIHNETITACLQDMMEPIGVDNLDQSGTAERVMTSSSGQIQIRAYTFETDTIKKDTQVQKNIDWFVDTREWIQVLSVTGDGQNLSGSVAGLSEKVQMGASVRIVVEYTNGLCQIVDADHLEVSSAGHVAAEIIYNTNVKFGENYSIAFANASSHHLWSAIITTEGDFNKYLYTYKKTGGEHKTVSHVDRFTWFIQM